MMLSVSGAAQMQSTKAKASFYADSFENRPMAGGGRFHQSIPSAASLQYPLGTLVQLSNAKTGQTILIRITDRGPWTKKYQLDLSKAAFTALGFDLRAGWGWVTVQVVPPEIFTQGDTVTCLNSYMLSGRVLHGSRRY